MSLFSPSLPRGTATSRIDSGVDILRYTPAVLFRLLLFCHPWLGAITAFHSAGSHAVSSLAGEGGRREVLRRGRREGGGVYRSGGPLGRLLDQHPWKGRERAEGIGQQCRSDSLSQPHGELTVPTSPREPKMPGPSVSTTLPLSSRNEERERGRCIPIFEGMTQMLPQHITGLLLAQRNPGDHPS